MHCALDPGADRVSAYQVFDTRKTSSLRHRDATLVLARNLRVVTKHEEQSDLVAGCIGSYFQLLISLSRQCNGEPQKSELERKDQRLAHAL